MQTDLNIFAIALDIALADKQANMNALEAALAAMPQGTDLVVLPELFTTGFVDNKEQAVALAETGQGDTVRAIEKLAEKHNCAICGSFLAKSGVWLFNRAFFVEPSGECTFYDKRHLFSLSNEPQIMSPGHEPIPVVRFRGWNIAMAVCYDLRFPVWLRNKGLKYDLLVIVANWPKKREYQWEHLLIARAIENQCYVIGANRGGEDSFGEYGNLSCVFDFIGTPIARQEGQTMAARLSMSLLEAGRQKFPFYNDAD